MVTNGALLALSLALNVIMKPKFNIYTFLKQRPLSWSALSSFEYDPEQWYSRYILGEKGPESHEMKFGKIVANSFGTDKPLAPVTLYPVVEQPLKVVFNRIPLIGFMDTYDPKTHNFREFKTAKTLWTKEKAEAHGQLRMYAMMLFITHKVKPEDYTIHLDCIQTIEGGDFNLNFVKPFNIVSYQVKITMQDILNFGARINKAVKEMEVYAQARLQAKVGGV